MLIISYQRTTG